MQGVVEERLPKQAVRPELRAGDVGFEVGGVRFRVGAKASGRTEADCHPAASTQTLCQTRGVAGRRELEGHGGCSRREDSRRWSKTANRSATPVRSMFLAIRGSRFQTE